MRLSRMCWRIPCFVLGILVYAVCVVAFVPVLAVIGLVLTVIPLVGEGILIAAWDTLVGLPNQIREGWEWCAA
jgi:hypothetical protein